MNKGVVIICDDEPAWRDLWKDAWERKGYRTVSYERVDPAIQAIRSHNFDIAVGIIVKEEVMVNEVFREI